MKVKQPKLDNTTLDVNGNDSGYIYDTSHMYPGVEIYTKQFVKVIVRRHTM